MRLVVAVWDVDGIYRMGLDGIMSDALQVHGQLQVGERQAFEKAVITDMADGAGQADMPQSTAILEVAHAYLFKAREIAQLVERPYLAMAAKGCVERLHGLCLVNRQFSVAVTVPSAQTDGFHCRVGKTDVRIYQWTKCLPCNLEVSEF